LRIEKKGKGKRNYDGTEEWKVWKGDKVKNTHEALCVVFGGFQTKGMINGNYEITVYSRSTMD